MKKRGFTLIELLVVVAVIAVVGVILTQVFYSSIRAGNKSQILAAIKQNGQSALDIMDKTIRSADQVVVSCSSGIVVASSALIIPLPSAWSGVYTRYRIIPEQGSSNGKILVDYPSLTPQDIDTPTELTDLCTTGIQSAPSTLTDDNTKTGVSVSSGSFTKNSLPGYKDSVTINLVIKPPTLAPKVIADSIDPVTFTTTVQLR